LGIYDTWFAGYLSFVGLERLIKLICTDGADYWFIICNISTKGPIANDENQPPLFRSLLPSLFRDEVHKLCRLGYPSFWSWNLTWFRGW